MCFCLHELMYVCIVNVGYEFSHIRVDDLIPRPFQNGMYLDERIVPAYSAYSQSNAHPEEQPKRDVIYMNYGRMEDYAALLDLNKGTGTLTKQSLENDVIIARSIINMPSAISTFIHIMTGPVKRST